MRYQKTWFSFVLVGVLAFIDIISIFVSLASEVTIFSTVLFALSSLGIFLAGTLTVRVDNNYLYVSYLFGLLTNTYHLGDFESVQAVENKNLISWIYNPTGKLAVSFQLRNGGKFHLPVENGLELIPYCRK